MVREPMKMKMCMIPGPMQSRSNPAALTIDLVDCEEDEVCVPVEGSPFPWPKDNMRLTIEIGYYFRLECI